jgi:hypothetical protein
MLPGWFDFHALRMMVAAGTVLCAGAAVLVLALVRQAILKVTLVVVLLAGAVALVAYDRGPLQHCRQQTTCRFLDSNLAVHGDAASR